jgi:hypothetical protein
MENIMLLTPEDEYFTPTVDFNAESGICTIGGESYLEESTEFYKPLSEWIAKYFDTYDKPLTLNLKLAYYNTNTSKKLLDLLHYIKETPKAQLNTTINWYYEENDVDTIEDVEDFMQITGLKINLIENSNI